MTSMCDSEEARVVWGFAPQMLPLALLHPLQVRWHDAWHGSRARKYVIRCSRRIGKSYFALIECDSLARTRPGAIIRYAAPTQKQVAQIIRPNMESKRWGILRSCPEDLRPRWVKSEGSYIYGNGSVIQIAGCDDGQYETLRGAACDLAVVDEAGFIDELKTVIVDVLLPQTLTTDGRLLIVSTPAKSPSHEFHAYDTEALERGAHQHATIYDAEHVTDDQREEYAAESGGKNTSTWRREYLAEWVVDTDAAIVPEFTDVASEIVVALDRPQFLDAYTVMDDGFEDLCVPTFAYWHFDRQAIVVEADIALRHANTDTVACAVRLREMEIWAGREWYERGLELLGLPSGTELEDLVERGMLKLVASTRDADQRSLHAQALAYARTKGVNLHRRALDGDPRLVADLSTKHGLTFGPVKKDDADAALAALRREVQRKKILVHPRARVVRTHFANGIWNKARTSFARSGGEFGHFDAIDSVKYLNREVNRSKNPFPTFHQGETPATHFIPPSNDNGAKSPEGRAIEAAFSRRVA